MFVLKLPTIKLHPALSTEQKALFKLYKNGLQPHFDKAFGWDNAQQWERFNKHYITENFLWIEQDKRIGALYLKEEPTLIHLSLLLIDGAFRNAGLGGQILQAIIQQSLPKAVELSLVKNNPALKLYKRLGFQITGEDDWFYDMTFNHPTS